MLFFEQARAGCPFFGFRLVLDDFNRQGIALPSWANRFLCLSG